MSAHTLKFMLPGSESSSRLPLLAPLQSLGQAMGRLFMTVGRVFINMTAAHRQAGRATRRSGVGGAQQAAVLATVFGSTEVGTSNTHLVGFSNLINALVHCDRLVARHGGEAWVVPNEGPPVGKDRAPAWPPGWSAGREVKHESDIFELLGLPYHPPQERNCP